MTETKFCINCKHLTQLNSHYICKRPRDISLVTGISELNNTFAELERTLNNTGCGAEARYFEDKGE